MVGDYTLSRQALRRLLRDAILLTMNMPLHVSSDAVQDEICRITDCVEEKAKEANQLTLYTYAAQATGTMLGVKSALEVFRGDEPTEGEVLDADVAAGIQYLSMLIDQLDRRLVGASAAIGVETVAFITAEVAKGKRTHWRPND